MTFQSKQDALDVLEIVRADWIAQARSVAHQIAWQQGSVTADDIHRACPIPEGIDRRVMGAVFRRDFEPIGFQLSERRACHQRPIRRFVLRGQGAE